MMIGIVSSKGEEIAQLCDNAVVYPSLRPLMRPLLHGKHSVVGIDLNTVRWPLVDALFGLPVIPPLILFGGEPPSELREGVDYLNTSSPGEIAAALSQKASQPPIFGKVIHFWPDSHTLSLNDTTIILTSAEGRILQLLLSQPGAFVPYDAIIDALRYNKDNQKLHSIRIAITRLRRKLMGYMTISNLYRGGYRIETGEYLVITH